MLTFIKNNKLKNLEDLFNEFSFDSLSLKELNQNTNIIERDNEYEVQLFYPGSSKEKFDISFENGIIELKVEPEKELEEDNYLFQGYYFRKIHEKYKISHKILKDEISASYENGVLKVILPKDKKEDENKKIVIK